MDDLAVPAVIAGQSRVSDLRPSWQICQSTGYWGFRVFVSFNM